MITDEMRGQAFEKYDIARFVNESVRKIQYWTDFGLITPGIKPSRGRGKKRLYSIFNCRDAGMIQIMKDEYHISLNMIKKILDAWGRNPKKEIFILDNSNDTIINGVSPTIIVPQPNTMCFTVINLIQLVKIVELKLRDWYIKEGRK